MADNADAAGRTAEIGIIGGSGLYDMEGLEEVFDFQLETPYGAPSSSIRTGRLRGRQVAFLARHGAGHVLLPGEVPYRANIYAMKMLGVSKLFGASAVGSLREDLPPRMLVVPDQFLDRTRHRPDTFFGDGLVVHVSLAEPFSEPLRQALIQAARERGHAVHPEGTQICMEGPQFSTRAESLIWKGLGCDVIGMTALTEARLAREAEIAYASLNFVTDYDAWRPEEAGVDVAEVLQVMNDNVHVGKDVLRRAVAVAPEGELPENRALASAIITRLERVPAATKERLAAILAPYLA